MPALVADAQPVALETQAQRRLLPTRAKKRLWTGRVLSTLALAFLAFDCSLKILQLTLAIEGTQQLGYPAHRVLTIGLIELACAALYAVPRTAAFGALMLTGYLGGAVATHFRLEAPLFSHTLFPIYIAALLWGGLYLRDPRVAALAPWAAKRQR